MIDMCCKSLMKEKAETYFQECTLRGFVDRIILNTMMDMYCKLGDDDRVETLFDKLPPDTESYNILLDLYGKRGQLTKAQSTFQKMVKSDVKPSEVSYNVLLNACARLGRVAQAEKFLEEMTEVKGLHPDKITYNTMLGLYAEKGMLKEASCLLKKATEKGINPDPYVLKLISNCTSESSKGQVKE